MNMENDMTLTQEEINAKADAATARYMMMEEDVAMIEMSYELQGWTASRTIRGHKVQSSVGKILELAMLMLIAQDEEREDTVSEFVRRYHDEGGKT